MKDAIAIALSGGIDSLVSASLLKQQGHTLIGIHFVTGFEPPHRNPDVKPNVKPNAKIDTLTAIPDQDLQTRQMVARIEDQLHIPVEIINISSLFQKKVVDYFIETYTSGRTPNPCMVCNAMIKFGTVLDVARNLGAVRLATGHYAGKTMDDEGKCHLFRGKDPAKDQSYFLAFLNQSQLSSACFPLSDLKKPDVIRLATEKNLTPVTRRESQDICFIQGETYGAFLSRRAEFKPEPGPITTMEGNVIGEHNGLHRFTIGQRRGINCPASEPYYVIRMEPTANRLVVGFKTNLLFSGCEVTRINWIQEPPVSPIDVTTQVRYRQKAVPSTLTPTGDDKATVRFHDFQSSITPGQGAVFYNGNEVLGGGWIESGK